MAASLTSAAPLTLTLFGPMHVLVQGQPLPHVRSRKGLWLLALLTLRHDRLLEREWLAGTLWPDMDQGRAFASLRTVLSELRSGLGSQSHRLQTPGRHTVMLDLAGADVDVLAFDAAIESGKLSRLENAVAIYRGPLLEGCNEEWVFQERSAREHDCLQALQKLGDSALSTGNYEAAIGHYRRAVSIDLWWEAARRGWMEAHSRNGDANAALQVYREFVEFLRNDPNATPDEQTSALYRRLRDEARQSVISHAVVTATETAAQRVAGYLPHPLTDLVGREDERVEIAMRLRRSRLVTLTGLGGIGKTRLAMEVAREAVREYADGVWLVALESLTDSNQVLPQIACVIGLREGSGRPLLEQLTGHLINKRLLLVLDNCEHLLEESARIAAHLLKACAGLRILATSREAMGITGETAWPVPALAVPDPEHLPHERATLLRVLMGYESVQLFVERAQAVRKSFALSGQNARMVAKLCSQLEGIPLAIELAAVRIKVMTVDQIVERLSDRLELLVGGSRVLLSRQRSLRATLDWSYKLLPEAGQQFLAALSVFRRGWTLEASKEIFARSEGEILDLLALLRDSSMIGEEDTAQGLRFTMLETIREYASEQLQRIREPEATLRRHRDYFLGLAQSAKRDLRGSDQGMWMDRLELEHDNLRSALTWSLKFSEVSARTEETKGTDDGSVPPAHVSLLLCAALQEFWKTRGYLAEGRAWSERALEAEGAQERTAARAKVLNGVGRLVWMQGDYASARAYFQEGLEIHRDIGDRSGIATSLNSLGNVAHVEGDFASSRAYFEESLAIRREIGDRLGIGTSLNNLGNTAINQGDYVAARAYHEESLAIGREIGDRQALAMSFNNLGIVALKQGDYAASRTYHEESLAIRLEIGDQPGIATSLDNLGGVAHDQGEYVAARAYHEESLAIRREIGDRAGIAISLTNLGTVANNQGDHAIAHAYFEESLTIWREIGSRRGFASTLYNLGSVTSDQGDFAAARACHAENLSIRREIGDRLGIVSSLEAFAVLIVAETTAFAPLAEAKEVTRETALGMRRAARLCGAAQSLREQIGTPQSPIERDHYHSSVVAAREALGETAFSAAFEEGRAMTWEQAVAYALEAPDL